MLPRGFSNPVLRPGRTSRFWRGTRLFHTRLWKSSKNLRLSTNSQWAECPFFFSTRSFTLSCPRYGADAIVRVPTMAESITEGTLTRFSKEVGEFIERDEELATIETDKIDVSVNTPHSGIIQQLLEAEGDTVTVDQAIAELRPEESPSETEANGTGQNSSELASNYSAPHSLDDSRPSAAPAITESLTLMTPESHLKLNAKSNHSLLQQSQTPKGKRGENRVKMTRIRQKTTQHLKESQNTAAFLTTFNEVDMSKIIEFRKNNKDTVMEKHGVKPSFMGAMAKASVLALKEIPAVNGSVENGDTIVYRDYVDLSVAASIPKGLVTPVLRNIESMSIVEIEKGISELVAKVKTPIHTIYEARANSLAKARDGKLTMDDLIGGSFTISNSGIWGSLFGTPIINTPQTAVLGTYGILDRPVAVNGQVEIRPMMYIALTYDHRIIDGREAVRFLNIVKDHLEQPERMLLG
ncbi:uncharacterized protein N7458_004595 [Penicillium daleae]|uniref:dihydrolipoyllysine-residue succinyltransferase n=1 Tax=Penicillium daleae TaxID=63821 RepID=A0AAD6G3Z3_9EURO|nr:uncharacterized protein N7458_004595 [Penicillium daleae]KAJ5453639.1 hypothetical protein N7458_004595 [Penicillium daleae]